MENIIEKASVRGLEDVVVFEPKVFEDARGYFMESFNQKTFEEAVGYPVEFVQDNESKSAKGVLRGLHFQAPPHAQGKLVRVIRGAVFDVAVDIRTGSPDYGKWVGYELSGDNKRQMWVPPGFAHGFITLEDDTLFAYKCTSYYNKDSEGSIHWNDPELAIEWPTSTPSVSEKDAIAPLLADLNSPFVEE